MMKYDFLNLISSVGCIIFFEKRFIYDKVSSHLRITWETFSLKEI